LPSTPPPSPIARATGNDADVWSRGSADGDHLLPHRVAAPDASSTAHENASTQDANLLPHSRDVVPRSAPRRDTPRHRPSARWVVTCGALVIVCGLAAWIFLGRSSNTSRSASAGAPAVQPRAVHAPRRPSQAAQQRAVADRAAQRVVRDALTAEEAAYADAGTYAPASAMKSLDPTIDWGGRVRVSLGDAETRGDRGVVCLSATSASGTTYAAADVALGAAGGTYYAPRACPAPLTASGAARLGRSFDPRP
jgi:hypothetical protein